MIKKILHQDFTMIHIKTLVLSSYLMLCMGSCTYNVSMAHTEGSATDVIDDTQSNSPDVSPQLSIPLDTI